MMKIKLYLFAIVTFLMLSFTVDIKAQNSTGKSDFLMMILANPTFELYDFFILGYTPEKVKLETESRYEASSKVQKKLREMNLTLHPVYMKCRAAYTLYKKRAANLDIEYAARVMVEFDINNLFAPKCPDPQLKKDLKTVPLRIQL